MNSSKIGGLSNKKPCRLLMTDGTDEVDLAG
jgi:hypothetical protein